MNAVCRALPLSQIAERYWSSTGRWKRRREDRRKLPFYQLENAAPQIYCELIHAEKNRTLLSKFRTENFSISRSCTITRCGKPRAGCDNSDPRDAPGAVGISAEELDARAWENTLRDLPVRTDSLMVYLKEEYGVTFPRFELGPLANSFTWSATAEKAGCNLHVLSRRAGESFAAL